ncbi:MAG: histidine phosphatase family protein [Patescibacteria group bacterium]|nr:histidine phosphatase family protein [Patescibacteria group bacterium]
MLKIYLARHGQNEDNVNGILNGHRDKPLTHKGIEQAHELADKIKQEGLSFDTIYSSTLVRAYETAKIISDNIGSSEPIKEPLLIERDFGIMTGQKVADVEKLCAPNIIKAEIITYFLDPEGAETFPDLMKRGRLLLDKIQSKHKDGNILLVTHGDIGKMIYAEYYNLDWKDVLTKFHFGNCDLLIMSNDSSPTKAHVFQITQYNH